MLRHSRVGLLVLAMLPACASSSESDTSSDEIRDLKSREVVAELTQIGELLKSNYGPLTYKKERFGFDLDEALDEAKKEIRAADNEADRVRPIFKLLAKLKDGHVSLYYPFHGESAATSSLPFTITPVQGAYLVANSEEESIQHGDKLVSIDGLTTAQLEEALFPITEIGTPESTRHLVGMEITQRPFYVPAELRPKGEKATVVVEHEDGSKATVEVPWLSLTGPLASQVTPLADANADGSNPAAISGRVEYLLRSGMAPKAAGFEADIDQWGNTLPFYLTPQVEQHLGMVEVAPKPETLKELGVVLPPTEAIVPEPLRQITVRAYKYKFAGKTILLVRIPTFSPRNKATPDVHVAWLAALLKENMAAPSGEATPALADAPADVVVVDVAHNPGGSVSYVQGMASLFASQPIPGQVQASRADRLFLTTLFYQAYTSDPAAREIALGRLNAAEKAYDEKQPLAPFMPLVGSNYGPLSPMTPVQRIGTDMLDPHPVVRWTKPTLVLHDELSASGGDVFPTLLQYGGVAKTFGARSAGMGGTVIDIATLPHSGADLRLTRGLLRPFTAGGGSAPLIENNGVTPDFPYEVTIADYRSGFVGYATAFSAIAATLRR